MPFGEVPSQAVVAVVHTYSKYPLCSAHRIGRDFWDLPSLSVSLVKFYRGLTRRVRSRHCPGGWKGEAKLACILLMRNQTPLPPPSRKNKKAFKYYSNTGAVSS